MPEEQASETVAQGLEGEGAPLVSPNGAEGAPKPGEPLKARLERLITLLREVVDTVESSPRAQEGAEPSPTVIREGRYEGANQHLFVDLRVDEGVAGVISADLYRLSASGKDYVASVRTGPGLRIALAEGKWPVVGQDEHGGRVTGTIALRGLGDGNGLDRIVGTIRLEGALHGLPARTDISFIGDWRSEFVRSIGLEIEMETGVAPLGAFDFNGKSVTFEQCFKTTGIDISNVGQLSRIPENEQGWGQAELHTLMQDLAQASLIRRAWELHLLLLSKSTRSGLLGVMFDTTPTLPRQGAAVFASEIRGIPGIQHERKLIQTTVHELGHALNLAHRFERVVGRADSTSFMNYDWRYKGGNRRDEFWSHFNFAFDRDEVEFLRHAPLSALIPGGSPFHSINYWADGNGGYSPYIPEFPLTGFELILHPPLGGPVFAFAQPVFLGVELKNLTGRTLEIPPTLLDPKSEALEILIRRREGASPSPGQPQSFVPILQRCFDIEPQAFDVVPHEGSIRNNLNLTFGSAGFSFAEPGEYEVTAVLALPDQQNQSELVLRSQPLRIRIGYPKSVEEERDAMLLLTDEVGVYLALGGSDGLPKAQQALEQVRERRQGKSKAVRDPIVANIVRCAGINVGRPYLRYQAGGFKRREGDREQAARLLESLDAQAMKAFDAQTALSTRKLAEKHRTAVSGRGSKARKKTRR